MSGMRDFTGDSPALASACSPGPPSRPATPGAARAPALRENPGERHPRWRLPLPRAWFIARLLFGALALALIAVMGLAAVPRVFGYPTFVVTGGSMGDALPLGGIAITHSVAPADVRSGDIIVFKLNEGRPAVAHRVVDAESEPGQRVFVTKGDANQSADPSPVVIAASHDVLRVIGYIPLAGYVARFVQTPAGWALLVMLPSGLMCLDLVRGVWSEEKPAGKRQRGGPSGEGRRWAI